VSVAITGLGVVSPLGRSVDAYWRGLCESDPTPDRLDTEQVPAGKLDNTLFYRSGGEAIDNARAAIVQALADAGLDPLRACVGLVLGTGAGDIDRLERAGFPEETLGAYGLAAELAESLGLTGPNLTVANACAASAYALLCGRDMLRRGEVDAVVICGVEAVSRTTLASFNRLMALDGERCRPFDARRAGTVLGDGAAALVLEPTGQDKFRYATLDGIGVSCDAHHPTAPREDGALIARSLELALADGNARTDDLAVVVPHGTGTRLNDAIESQMLRSALGERASSVPLFPLKAKIGHGGGAAGAFAALTLALILSHRRIPPTHDLAVDPELGVRVPGRTLPVLGERGLVNAYAFGGNNISLVLGA
jgi:3-oxoacyl-(acyl-carrier-protein) synthase